jgi:cell division protein YceG involved in septum cleavage
VKPARNPAMRRALIVFVVTIVLGLGATAFVARTAWKYGDTPGGTAQGRVEVEIAKGATARDVAARLAAVGLIDRPFVFRLYAGQRGVSGRFKAGRYELTAPATPKQILETLVKGAADELVAVTIPEG